jgi:hypothetical protein
LCGNRAAASSTFPAAVDQALGLTASQRIEVTIDPPLGCRLCHENDSGGNGTNNAFGLDMLMSGAIGTAPSTVGPALAAIQRQNPRAVSDIVMGVNPNDDPLALSDDPVPMYGCGSVAASGTSFGDLMAAVGASLVIVAGRARRRRGS